MGLIKYIKTAEKERIIFHAKDKSLSEITLLPYAVTFGIIEPLIDFDTEPRIIDESEYKKHFIDSILSTITFILTLITVIAMLSGIIIAFIDRVLS